MRHRGLQKNHTWYKMGVILGPLWMVRHRLVDEVTGDVNDVNAFMVDLERIKND